MKKYTENYSRTRTRKLLTRCRCTERWDGKCDGYLMVCWRLCFTTAICLQRSFQLQKRLISGHTMNELTLIDTPYFFHKLRKLLFQCWLTSWATQADASKTGKQKSNCERACRRRRNL